MASFDDSPFIYPINIDIFSYKKFNGLANMAVDHYLSINSDKYSTPILRFFGWNPYCVSLGYHQSEKIVDFQKLQQLGYHCVKRPTGGRAIFHAQELTYSLVFPKNIISRADLYQYFHKTIMRALISLGYNVEQDSSGNHLPKIEQKATDFPCFTRKAETEIVYKNKKVVGSAQKIYADSILQHGSILIDRRHEELADLLFAVEKDKEEIADDINEKTTCLKKINNMNLSPEILEKAITKQLEKNTNISLIYKELKQSEIDAAVKKYNSDFGKILEVQTGEK